RLHEDDYEEDYEEFFASIAAAKEDIAAKEHEIDLLNLKKKCPECGAEMTGMDDKCPNCGASAAYDTELKEEEAVDSDDDAEESDFLDADFDEVSDE
ncbi:MAG: hypothetical protein LUF92_08780, partial [Clostridiales bacterium]|nr:hypothetical protein [Clostridiales bacterium]